MAGAPWRVKPDPKTWHHRAKATHCIRGHELAGANLYVHPKTGHRKCLTCYHLRRRGRI